VSTMGKYCKAYHLKALRAFDGWSEKVENARRETEIVDGKEVETVRELTDDAVVYVQENYVVTDGIFKDENILFDDVTPEWVAYCQEGLAFEIPEYARGELEPVVGAEDEQTE
jgi:hypothetical protein